MSRWIFYVRAALVVIKLLTAKDDDKRHEAFMDLIEIFSPLLDNETTQAIIELVPEILSLFGVLDTNVKAKLEG
jgi:hypothetical protein